MPSLRRVGGDLHLAPGIPRADPDAHLPQQPAPAGVQFQVGPPAGEAAAAHQLGPGRCPGRLASSSRRASSLEAAKRWAAERLHTVEAAGHIERVVQNVGAFSQSLCRHRPDQGAGPAALSRTDMLAFLNDLAHLETAGRLSRHGRRSLLCGVAMFLREARAMGLARPGSPLSGLPDDVAIAPGDRIRGQRADSGPVP